MIRSMTGYGKKESTAQRIAVTAEIRSVNHRFLEVAVRLPRSLTSLEEQVRKTVQQHCLRGRVDVSVSLHTSGGSLKTVEVDQTLANQYHTALKKLQKGLGLRGKVDVSTLAGFRDILSASMPSRALRAGLDPVLTGGLFIAPSTRTQTCHGCRIAARRPGRGSSRSCTHS